MAAFDRFYIGILASVVTICLMNIRILLARPRLFLTKAGVAHFLSNLFAMCAGLDLTINESLLNSMCTLELGFGCGLVHVSKLLNHLILFWRCSVVTHQHPILSYSFYGLVICKITAVAAHCSLMKPFYDSVARLCLDKLEPISTLSTFTLDMVIDFSLTLLFMIKIYDQIRKSNRYTCAPAAKMQRLFREYVFEAIPMLSLSICLNAIIVSDALAEYTLIIIYTDLILQLRLTNDLLVLNRLTDNSVSSPQTSNASQEQRSTRKFDPPEHLSLEENGHRDDNRREDIRRDTRQEIV
ncbi:uncharacterized protein VTP21DRAFT_6000 [Calcarisporiella thermophila]|uniref:uncharacterized protein n=1 Tax=Calcarisporiella thermophila TaxID=911321 RepID=UPI003741FA2B